MSHFAEIGENNVVLRVLVGDNRMTDEQAKAWFESRLGGRWLQTSYNGKIRKNFAGVGYTYDEDRDAFIPPKPYPSWILDETCNWNPPTPCPGIEYSWDEENLSWVLLRSIRA